MNTIPSKRIIDEFYRQVQRRGPDDCWLWVGRLNEGYGLFRYRPDNPDRSRKDPRRFIQAHRFAFLVANGFLTPGLVVMHSCDTPNCVNPRHLSEGTFLENSRDREAKGRGSKVGSKGNNRGKGGKVTPEQVVAIRNRRAAGGAYEEIAAEFSVKKSTVEQICTGRTWRHIGGPITPAKPRVTAEQVAEIRRRRAAGERLKTIGKDFDLTEGAVSMIARGVHFTGLS